MLASFHSFLDFHGKVALVGTMTNLLDFPMIFIGCQHRPIFQTSVFFYIGASFTTFLWFGIDSELDLFLWLSIGDFLMIFLGSQQWHALWNHNFINMSTLANTAKIYTLLNSMYHNIHTTACAYLKILTLTLKLSSILCKLLICMLC